MTDTEFKPFAEGSSSHDVCGLTVENGTAAIALYGQTSLTRDKAGLQAARSLLAFARSVVEALEAAGSLPAAVPAAVPDAKPAGRAKNPFS